MKNERKIGQQDKACHRESKVTPILAVSSTF